MAAPPKHRNAENSLQRTLKRPRRQSRHRIEFPQRALGEWLKRRAGRSIVRIAIERFCLQPSPELTRLVGVMDGWEGLDDELTEAYLDQIGTQLAQVLDQRDYVVYQLIRRYLVLLDYNTTITSPTLGDCFSRLMQWPVEFQADEIDLLLSRKADLLKGITSATMRERTNMVNAARILPAVIQSYLTLMPHRLAELVALMHEANYTTVTKG
jgi:hypothetical protein